MPELASELKVPYGPDVPPSAKTLTSKGGSKGKSKGTGKGFLNLPTGITEVVLKEAEPGSWKRPKNFDEVEVHVVGTVSGRTVSEESSTSDSSQTADPLRITFFSSRLDGKYAEPLKWILGSGCALTPSLELAICTMRQGQISRFDMSPEHAFGERGFRDDDDEIVVPPGSPVSFEVELLRWTARDDLFNNGRAVKSVRVEGSSWQKPQASDEVRISYVAITHDDGDKLVEVYDTEYALGSGAAYPPTLALTLERALSCMRRGEKAVVTCAPGQAFRQDHGAVDVEIELHEICEVSDISLKRDGSMMKKRLRQGEGFERPQEGGKVWLCIESVTAGIVDGEKLVECPKSLEVIAGNGDVCDALEILILDMQVGERARLTCYESAAELCADKGLQVDLGLSSRAAGLPRVIVFNVELCSLENGPDPYSLSEEGKIDLAGSRKDVGNALFRQQRWVQAIERYKKVLDVLRNSSSFSEELKTKADDIKRSAELNKAACGLRLEDWELALAACNSVLKGDSSNAKALFRRGSAHIGLKNIGGAVADARRCLELEPNNADAKRLLQRSLAMQKSEDKKSKAVFSKMCQGLGRCGQADEERGKENTTPNPSNAVAASTYVQVPSVEDTKTELAISDSKGPSDIDAKSMNSQLIIAGAQVRVEGLVARSDLNGQEGHVVAWDGKERRWRVKLSTGQGLCLKPANMVVLCAGAPRERRVQYGPPPPPLE
mmetsp:Transcript_78168/g.121948  ORF Transcript_78168/g.121948 Transcript_78168/m.121948 type:complete len:721 (-) Transcript_78168:69-2231(-)